MEKILLKCDPPVLTVSNSDILCAKAILAFCEVTITEDTANILSEDKILERLHPYIKILPSILICKTVVLATSDYIYSTYTKPKAQLFLFSPPSVQLAEL